MAALTDPYGTTGQLTLKWDPKNLEIRTTSVERTLEPLVLQVTTLVNSKDKTAKKKRPGKSKRASALVATVERATEIFIERGQTIAYENPEITQEMLAAVEEVRKAGAAMSLAAREFSEEPCASAVRSAMVRAARALLSAVTRLLILADMVDVHLLLAKLRAVETDLDKLKSASSQSELVESARQFGRSANELAAQAAKRQKELKEPRMKDELAAARAVLKKHSTMLLTASKVYVRHPELAAAKANRDFVLRAVCSAVDTISAVAQGRPLPAGGNNRPPIEGPGELAQALDDFDERMVMEPLAYSELRTRPSLEERLESIISGAALMADSSCTRDERRERIVAECNAVRQALQELLHEYMTNAGKAEQSEGLERAIEHMCRKTRDLRRQLRKAVVDHVSDSFLETNVPLLVLMEAARNGNEKEVEEYAIVFTEHANKLVEVAKLVCSMSNNEDGVKMVRHAAAQIEALCPQVINAARVLGARCRSRVAQDNGAAFAAAWDAAVRLLTLAVDDVTTIDDFLAVSENHILEDVNKCVVALQEGDPDSLERTAGAIRGRAARVCSVVTQEMDNYEPCIYTKRVLEAVTVLRDQGK
ncbi:Catenin alpha [Papilio machaon]|uniref:Catenin alpha n=1 Tax=Papilio machaon TaxID=76193 RepID=A0A0N1IPM9_PAPMA|nr:Catenin alpha [Papilio machaon]